MKAHTAIVVLLAIGGSSISAHGRTWTSISGKTEEGDLVGIREGTVFVRRASDSKVCRAAWTQLSKNDQHYVWQQVRRRTAGAFDWWKAATTWVTAEMLSASVVQQNDRGLPNLPPSDEESEGLLQRLSLEADRLAEQRDWEGAIQKARDANYVARGSLDRTSQRLRGSNLDVNEQLATIRRQVADWHTPFLNQAARITQDAIKDVGNRGAALSSAAKQMSATIIVNGKGIQAEIEAEILQGRDVTPHGFWVDVADLPFPPQSALVIYLKHPVDGTKATPPVSKSYAAWFAAYDENGRLSQVEVFEFESDNRSRLIDEMVSVVMQSGGDASIAGAEKLAASTNANQHNRLYRSDLEEGFARRLGHLRSELLDPIQVKTGLYTRKFRRWFISPAAQTWLVPFAALRVDRNSRRYAIEGRQISYLMTGRDRLVNPEKAQGEVPLIIASPDFDVSVARRKDGAVPGQFRQVAWPRLRNKGRLRAATMAHRTTTLGYSTGCVSGPRWQRAPATGWCADVPGRSCGVVIAPGCVTYQNPCQSLPWMCGCCQMRSKVKPLVFAGTNGLLAGNLGNFAPLPGAVVRLGQEIATRRRTPRFDVGAQASETAFRAYTQRGVDSPRELWVLTHGFFCKPPACEPSQADSPLDQCGLALAGANEVSTLQRVANDGLLLGSEIAEQNLTGTDFVVAIACVGGVGEVTGASLASLRHSFLLAGARSVVATSWSVPVRESRLLMSRYLRELAQGNTEKEAALQVAQRGMIDELRQQFGRAHPFFWASFSLTGQVD